MSKLMSRELSNALLQSLLRACCRVRCNGERHAGRHGARPSHTTTTQRDRHHTIGRDVLRWGPHKLLGLAAAALLSAGCALGPDYEQPVTELPQEWPEHDLFTGREGEVWRSWWAHFDDPLLDELVARALDENLDIRLQAQRVREAHARLGFAEAERRPTLNAQAEAARERRPETISPLPEAAGTGNLFSLSGILGYEVDLWGRLARQREAAEAMLEQSAFSRDAVRLNIAADVVTTYVSLRAAEEQLVIAEERVALRERTLKLEAIRYQEGEADVLALRQARSELASARAQIPPLREQVLTLESALAMLIGAEPGAFLAEFDFGDHSLRDLRVPTGAPADAPAEIVRRRPDIRAAEAGLIAATAEIGVAEANRLPRVSLSAVIGTVAPNIDDLFTGASETRTIGASVGGPLFDFGRSRARIETAEALRDQAETRYTATITAAFREIRDAMVLYESSTARIDALRELIEAVEETQEIAQIRYDEGLIGRLQLLDAERSLLEAQLNEVAAVRDRLTAIATLFKALGGGWGEAIEANVTDGANAGSGDDTDDKTAAPASRSPAPSPALPFRAYGQEPSWHVEIQSGHVVWLTDYGTARRVLPLEPVTRQIPQIETERAAQADLTGALVETVHQWQAADGEERIVVTAQAQLCRDSMSGMPHPYTVTLHVYDQQHSQQLSQNGQTGQNGDWQEGLHGCGGEPLELLTGQEWVMERIAEESLADHARVTLQFDGEEGQIAGAVPCNRYHGEFHLTGENLTFGAIATTRMACPEPLMALERSFLDALTAVTAFDIGDDDGRLILTGRAATLTARPASEK
ncbi:hypothetical protein CKO15_04490 [Halorhodospira abdelmalekii]|nr:hypothetical protein [Halorhodospira abdelmalekii]